MYPPSGMHAINHFYGPLYDAVSIAYYSYIAANDRIIYELEKILKCICYWLIKVRSLCFNGGIPLGYLVSWPRFEHHTSEYKSTSLPLDLFHHSIYSKTVFNGIAKVQKIFLLKLGFRLIKVYYDSHGT
jgi:hypothetical protein